ncbi:MAG: 4-hydroxy-3-methylbut-2-enyl diphosphate reductase [Lachnospiraceae bacterium]|nr:4-hydroxy-3-methylbut-2-enyl diphosphate reductase [Lachnospiraceae bacterium]
MEVRLADPCGFCFGVKRAVDGVYEQLKSGRPIYTYGPVVHNETVVSDLESKGVKVIADKESLESMTFEPDAVVVIRAHGIGRDVYKILEEKGCETADFTCPFVQRIHDIVLKESREGKYIVIVGNPAHPEIIGICGWCDGPYTVVKTGEEAEGLDIDGDITVVAQTTFQHRKFSQIVEIISKKGYNTKVVNTICSATKDRQDAAEVLSKTADAMIVIGGSASSNTRRLYEIASENCPNTVCIQKPDDLVTFKLPESVNLIGITAGASTPQNIIEEVQKYVRGIDF